jgi:hypothetical protein
LFPKTSLDGTTVTSADLELPGTLRTLAWVVVLDDAARMGLHLLIDSHDIDERARLGLRIAPAHLGHELTSGMWAVTTTCIVDAVVGTYPVPSEAVDTFAEINAPARR